MKVWLGIWNSEAHAGRTTAHPDWRDGDVLLIYDHAPSGTETLFTWLCVDVADMAEAEALYGREYGIPAARLDVAALKTALPKADADKVENITKMEPMDETDVIPELDKQAVWDACDDVNAVEIAAKQAKQAILGGA